MFPLQPERAKWALTQETHELRKKGALLRLPQR